MLWSLTMQAQEDAVRFFDLETKPVISVLYDQTFKRDIPEIPIPFNIYASSNQRISVNIVEQMAYDEAKKEYLTQVYTSRIEQQQNRIHQTTKTSASTTLQTGDENRESNWYRPRYNQRAYGWQNDFYNHSSLWVPSFYQHPSNRRLRTHLLIAN